MNVLIDIPLISKSGGSTRHLQNFISALERSKTDINYFMTIDKSLASLVDFSHVKKTNIVYIDKSSKFKSIKYTFYGYRNIITSYDIAIVVSLINIGFIFPPIPQVNFQRNALTYSKNIPTDGGLKSKLRNHIERLLFIKIMKDSACVVIPTRAMQEMIMNFTNDRRINFCILPHAINLQELKVKHIPQDKSARFLERDNNKRLLYVSHFMPHKNHFILIDALSNLISRGCNVKLYLTIDKRDWPTGYTDLISKLKSLNLVEHVVLLSRTSASEVSYLYRNSDIFAFPSLCESFGFPLMEAMACGSALVVADTPVNREICSEAALYHDPYSSIDLADKVYEILKDRNLFLDLKERSYERFHSTNLSWDEYVTRFEKILKGIDRN